MVSAGAAATAPCACRTRMRNDRPRSVKACLPIGDVIHSHSTESGWRSLAFRNTAWPPCPAIRKSRTTAATS